jgi:ribosomal-protein-alanine N-acetyltransferase
MESALVRPARAEDCATLARLDGESLTGSWTREAFEDELGKSFARLRVMTHEEVVVGFVHAWVVADELQVLNVATARAARRQGVGRTLLRALFAEVRAAGCAFATLEVRTSNAPAIALYRGLGFSDDCVRHGYYSDGADALLMSARW